MTTPNTVKKDKSLQQQSSTTNASPSIPPGNEHDGGAKISKSVNELNDLSIAIQVFKSRYDELQKHLEFIEQAIDTRTKEFASSGKSTVIENAQEAIDTRMKELVALDKSTAEGNAREAIAVQPDGKSDSDSKPNVKEESGEGEENELVSLCQTMCSRDLRRYVLSRLSETTTLREQVPLALKSAPKPSKLVFESIGRFFLQGSRAYTKDSHMISARQVSILILEYYLLSGCVGSETEVDPSLEEEASSAAVSWRKRIIAEGGVTRANETDARGLLLFIACFGIPSIFRNEDVWNLVILSNPKEISHALCQSQDLLKRVSDIAEGMMKKGMVVEVVDMAYTLGLEEKFPPQTILTSFLLKSDEAWKKAKQARDSPSVLKEAHEKYLTALKSVVNCLEGHKIDFVKLLPGWQLKDKIVLLEKDISDAKKKIEEKSKRRVDKSNSSNKKMTPEPKRARFTVNNPSVASPSVTALEQRIASRLDSHSSYDGLLTAHLLDGRSYGYLNNYPTAASVQIGSASVSLPESYLGSTVASGSGTPGRAMSGGISSIPTGSFSLYQGDLIRGDIGTTLNSSSSHLYRWNGVGEGALSNDRSVGQSYVGQSASALGNNLYGKTSTESFSGLPDLLSVGVASRSVGSSDLYSFADSVFDS